MDKASAASIELLQVTKSYVLDEVQVSALSGISLRIEPGSIVSIVGRSGSGKSTLLNILGGLDRPSAGEVLVDGQGLQRKSSDELARYRREMIGFIFQSFYLIPHHTALENVTLALALANVGHFARRDRARELLKLVGLEKRMTHRPSQLSGGERQRVAIARALANDPKVLLADEPTGNLDSRTAEEILELIVKTSTDLGRTVVLVTHERDHARRYTKRMIELADGRVVADGATDVPVVTAIAPPAQGGAS
jgi:putative ABC transport system ATP-binding protein